MLRDGTIKLSPKFTIDDYLNLNLDINSPEAAWERALEILKDRFYERFFSNIRFLSRDKNKNISEYRVEKNSFTIMALNCLLVDALFQFEYGLESSTDKNPVNGRTTNSENYVFFLMKAFPHLFGEYNTNTNLKDKSSLAYLFYQHIRCGILHSAQTKDRSTLACDNSAPVSYLDGTHTAIKVNVVPFSEELERYFYRYMDRLRNNNEEGLRENFIKKMKFVCNIPQS